MGVNVLFIIGTIFLFMFMAGAIITIIKARRKETTLEKILYYIGIGVLFITAIYSFPILCNYIGDLAILGIIICVVALLKGRK